MIREGINVFTVGELIDELQKYPADAIIRVANAEDPEGQLPGLLSSVEPGDIRVACRCEELSWLEDYKPNRPEDVNAVSLTSVPQKLSLRYFLNRLEDETAEQIVRRGGHSGDYYTGSNVISLQDVADSGNPNQFLFGCIGDSVDEIRDSAFWFVRQGRIVHLPLKLASQVERDYLRTVLVDASRELSVDVFEDWGRKQLQMAIAICDEKQNIETKEQIVPPRRTLARRLTANSPWEWSTDAKEWQPVTDDLTLSLIENWKGTYADRYGLPSDDEEVVLLRNCVDRHGLQSDAKAVVLLQKYDEAQSKKLGRS